MIFFLIFKHGENHTRTFYAFIFFFFIIVRSVHHHHRTFSLEFNSVSFTWWRLCRWSWCATDAPPPTLSLSSLPATAVVCARPNDSLGNIFPHNSALFTYILHPLADRHYEIGTKWIAWQENIIKRIIMKWNVASYARENSRKSRNEWWTDTKIIAKLKCIVLYSVVKEFPSFVHISFCHFAVMVNMFLMEYLCVTTMQ